MNTKPEAVDVENGPAGAFDEEAAAAPLRYLVPAGRALYAGIFIMAAAGHFSRQTIEFTAQQGVPLAGLLVPASGLLALAGGLSVLLGYRARLGAWLLVLFLVPVTVAMHRFWAIEDPMMAQLDQAMFLKNVSMVGAALLITRFGAGPLSLDARAGGSEAGRARVGPEERTRR